MNTDQDTQTTELNRWQKRKARTREQLKDCTLELLLEKSYADLTVQDITDRADLARGTFYVHFKDKEDITWSLLRESIDELTDEVMLKYQDEPYLRRKYLTWKRVFEYARQHQNMLRVMLGDRGHPAFTQRIQDYLSVYIQQGIDAGIYQTNLPTPVPASYAAQFVTGALVRMMLWSLGEEGMTYTPAQLGQLFYEILNREAMPDEFKA